MRYLLDTNVFYDLASEDISLVDFVAKYGNDKLFCAPISFVEIITSLNDFIDKQSAAKQMITLIDKHGMKILPNSNDALLEQHGGKALTSVEKSTNTLGNMRIYATHSEQEIENLPNNPVEEMRVARNITYKFWAIAIANERDDIIADYGKKGGKKLTGTSLRKFRNEIHIRLSYNHVNGELIKKLELAHGVNISNVPSVIPQDLKIFADVYRTHMHKLVEGTPRKTKKNENDFGDIEQFLYYGLYVDRFITSEDWWFNRVNELATEKHFHSWVDEKKRSLYSGLIENPRKTLVI